MATTETPKKEKKHVYQLALPPSTVSKIDEYARANGLSRSALVTMILTKYVQILKG